MYKMTQNLRSQDPDLWDAIQSEAQRQEDHIEFIASENYASPAVMEAQGCSMTNKYAEGYPGHRYYHGCDYVDRAETLAIERLKKLFKADYVNVQPHSGSTANQVVYFAMLQPGDTILGMSLSNGGHLTHGASVNISGKIFKAVTYGLHPDTELIDYDEVQKLAVQHRPKMIVTGASAYSRVIDWARFRKIADSVGAYLMADIAHYAGLIAAGVYPSPVGIADFVTSTTHKTLRGPRGGIVMALGKYEKPLNSMLFPGLQGGPLMHVIAAKAVAFGEALQPSFKTYQQQVLTNAKAMAKTITDRGMRIVSGGTDSHVFLVDLRAKKITGKHAADAMEFAHMTINKNAIPNDPEKPAVTSGLRFGSPAITTRGFGAAEASLVAGFACDIIEAPDDEGVRTKVVKKIIDLCRQFPVYETQRL